MIERSKVLSLVVAAILPASALAADVSTLLQRDVADATSREIVVLEVTYPPGGSSDPHRHNSHTIVYVLEGSVVMQVAGGEKRTLTVGETFYESPDDIHSVSMNASDTAPARILVFFLKERGAPLSTSADAPL